MAKRETPDLGFSGFPLSLSCFTGHCTLAAFLRLYKWVPEGHSHSGCLWKGLSLWWDMSSGTARGVMSSCICHEYRHHFPKATLKSSALESGVATWFSLKGYFKGIRKTKSNSIIRSRVTRTCLQKREAEGNRSVYKLEQDPKAQE